MSESLFSAGKLTVPLPSELRSPEQMEWINDRFKLDGLARLARAEREYADSHGVYLPDVAALAHAALTALDGLIALAETVIQDIADTCDCDDHVAEIATYRLELERLRGA